MVEVADKLQEVESFEWDTSPHILADVNEIGASDAELNKVSQSKWNNQHHSGGKSGVYKGSYQRNNSKPCQNKDKKPWQNNKPWQNKDQKAMAKQGF